jgi:hypothetical protein
MKSHKRDRLKRNPLVRFIRGVFRLLRVILKPKNSKLRSLHYEQNDLPQVGSQPQPILAVKEQYLELQRNLEPEQELDLDSDRPEQFISVGKLFEQIKWQIPTETTIQTNPSDLSTKPQPYDVSRN